MPGTEGIQHGFVSGHVRHDAQFDLRIVQREQGVARVGDEAAADAAAFFCTGWDLLEIWIR